MQFRKLLNILNLINAKRQCQCHQLYEQHYRPYHHRHQHLNTCNWNFLMFVMVLIGLMTIELKAENVKKINFNQSLNTANTTTNNAVESLATLNSTKDIENSSEDFQRIILAQLKREEVLKKHTDKLNLNGDYDTTAADGSQRKALLSRKRRYLLFPEGSSFQLVYDTIIGVVDYTNYLILGITVALAWELPSKAPSEMLEDIKMQLNDGTLFQQRNDNATKITYVDTKKTTKTNNLQKQQLSKPNNIKFADQNSSTTQKQFNGYYQTNIRRIMQPAFIPPMHRNYYHQNLSENLLPNTFYRTRPMGISNKYAYYFQPKFKSNGARNSLPDSSYNYDKERLGDWRRKDSYYYNQKSRNRRPPTHPFTKWLPGKSSYIPSTTYANSNINSKYPWWNLASRLTNSLRGGTDEQKLRPFGRQFNAINDDEYENHQHQQQQQQSQPQTSRAGYYQSNAPTTSTTKKTRTTKKVRTLRKHRIYPVFGKRSIPDKKPDLIQQESPTLDTYQQPVPPEVSQHRQQQQQQQPHHHHHPRRQRRRCGIDNDELSKFDRIHIRHHRRTRRTLYEKIEKYLDKRGSHGHHCVLRALCETGQKANEIEPGSFVGELMRALFTIPEPIEDDLHRLEYIEHRYDAAHAYAGSCAKRFFHCKESLWESHFVA